MGHRKVKPRSQEKVADRQQGREHSGLLRTISACGPLCGLGGRSRQPEDVGGKHPGQLRIALSGDVDSLSNNNAGDPSKPINRAHDKRRLRRLLSPRHSTLPPRSFGPAYGAARSAYSSRGQASMTDRPDAKRASSDHVELRGLAIYLARRAGADGRAVRGAFALVIRMALHLRS